MISAVADDPHERHQEQEAVPAVRCLLRAEVLATREPAVEGGDPERHEREEDDEDDRPPWQALRKRPLLDGPQHPRDERGHQDEHHGRDEDRDAERHGGGEATERLGELLVRHLRGRGQQREERSADDGHEDGRAEEVEVDLTLAGSDPGHRGEEEQPEQRRPGEGPPHRERPRVDRQGRADEHEDGRGHEEQQPGSAGVSCGVGSTTATKIQPTSRMPTTASTAGTSLGRNPPDLPPEPVIERHPRREREQRTRSVSPEPGLIPRSPPAPGWPRRSRSPRRTRQTLRPGGDRRRGEVGRVPRCEEDEPQIAPAHVDRDAPEPVARVVGHDGHAQAPGGEGLDDLRVGRLGHHPVRESGGVHRVVEEPPRAGVRAQQHEGLGHRSVSVILSRRASRGLAGTAPTRRTRRSRTLPARRAPGRTRPRGRRPPRARS